MLEDNFYFFFYANRQYFYSISIGVPEIIRLKPCNSTLMKPESLKRKAPSDKIMEVAAHSAA